MRKHTLNAQQTGRSYPNDKYGLLFLSPVCRGNKNKIRYIFQVRSIKSVKKNKCTAATVHIYKYISYIFLDSPNFLFCYAVSTNQQLEIHTEVYSAFLLLSATRHSDWAETSMRRPKQRTRKRLWFGWGGQVSTWNLRRPPICFAYLQRFIVLMTLLKTLNSVTLKGSISTRHLHLSVSASLQLTPKRAIRFLSGKAV